MNNGFSKQALDGGRINIFRLLTDFTASSNYSKTFIPLAMTIQQIRGTFLRSVAMATPCGAQTEVYMLLVQNARQNWVLLTSTVVKHV